MAQETADDTIAYNYRPERELWNSWKLTVRRDKPLNQRLDELLALDRDNDLNRLVDKSESGGLGADVDDLRNAIERADPGDDRVRLDAVRIRRRCMTALPNARENGADKAADELAEIQQIVNDLLDA